MERLVKSDAGMMGFIGVEGFERLEKDAGHRAQGSECYNSMFHYFNVLMFQCFNI